MDPRSDNQLQNAFNGYYNDEYSDAENVDTREIDAWYDRMEKEEEEYFKAQDEEEKKVSFIHSNGITIRVENNPNEDEEEFKDGDFKSKELIIKSNNITIKIIKSHQYPHAIFDVKNLLQLVQDYLQYEDALEVFIWFRLAKPIRPKLFMKDFLYYEKLMEAYREAYLSLPKPRYLYDTGIIRMPKRPLVQERNLNVDRWYVKDNEINNFLSFFEDFYTESELWIKCSNCKEYKKVEVVEDRKIKSNRFSMYVPDYITLTGKNIYMSNTNLGDTDIIHKSFFCSCLAKKEFPEEFFQDEYLYPSSLGCVLNKQARGIISSS